MTGRLGYYLGYTVVLTTGALLLLSAITMALTAGMPACLEPTADELASFGTSDDGLFHPLHDIFRWAGFTWGVKYKHSPGATLLTALGSDWLAKPGAAALDPKAPTMAVDEFASTPVEEFETSIGENEWEFAESSDPAVIERDHLGSDDRLIKSKHLHRSQARKAHQAANLFCGFIIPRAVQQTQNVERDDKLDKYRLEKLDSGRW